MNKQIVNNIFFLFAMIETKMLIQNLDGPPENNRLEKKLSRQQWIMPESCFCVAYL